MDAGLLDLDPNEILLRAELLLLDVSNVVLRNVPEANEVDQTVDDEAVRTLLKEGGHPPHQLVLPSVYRTNQRVLEKLSVASVLRIELKQLLVLSARYGIRKEGSFFVIHPPSGCPRRGNEPQSVRIPLDELQDRVAQILQKNAKANSMRNYFVGCIDLSRSVELKLDISDQAMQDWTNCAPGGCLRIELFGYLNPPGTIVRGELCGPDRFATATVPLAGLLGTVSLDLVVQCDLIADLATKSLVASRMLNISFGQRTKHAEALSDKLGTLSARVSVVAGPASASHAVKPPSRATEMLASDESKGEDPVHAALRFVPEEAPRRDPLRPMTVGEVLNATDGKKGKEGKDGNAAVFALVLCALEGFKMPIDTLLEIERHGAETTLSLSYKTSQRQPGNINLSCDASQRSEQEIMINQIRIHAIHGDAQWKPPVVELWVSWSTNIDGEVRTQKRLLGLAKFPAMYKLGAAVMLAVTDVARGVQRGVLRVACVVGAQEEPVDASAHCVLNAFHLARMARPPVPVASVPTHKAAAAPELPPAADSQENSVPESSVLERSVKVELSPKVVQVEATIPEPHHRSQDTAPAGVAEEKSEERIEPVPHTQPPSDFQQHEAEGDTQPSSAVQEPSVTIEPAVADSEHNHDADADVDLDSVAASDHAHIVTASASKMYKDRASTGTGKCHKVDFQVDGAFSLLQPVAHDQHYYEGFGCYVCYTLQDARSASTAETTAPAAESAVWWDAECPVFNGKQEHHFVTHDDSVGAIAAAIGCLGDNLRFTLRATDADRNLQEHATVLGVASLSMADFAKFVVSEEGYKQFSVPVALTRAAVQQFQVTARGQDCRLVLKASHTVVPTLLRHSASFGDADASSAVESNTSADLTADAAERTQQVVANDRTSSLLGFEITQADLDGMLYYRDPLLPLPWLPFQQTTEPSEQAEQDGSVQSHSLRGQRLFDRPQRAEPLQDFTSLRQQLMDLEYIHTMLPAAVRRGQEGVGEEGEGEATEHNFLEQEHDVVEQEQEREQEHGLHRDDEDQVELRSVNGDDQDAGERDHDHHLDHDHEHDREHDHDDHRSDSEAELYPSDFESVDDATVDDILRLVQGDLEQAHRDAASDHHDQHDQYDQHDATCSAQEEASQNDVQETLPTTGIAIPTEFAVDKHHNSAWAAVHSLRSSMQSISTDSSAAGDADDILQDLQGHGEGGEMHRGMVETLSDDGHDEYSWDQQEEQKDHRSDESDAQRSLPAQLSSANAGFFDRPAQEHQQNEEVDPDLPSLDGNRDQDSQDEVVHEAESTWSSQFDDDASAQDFEGDVAASCGIQPTAPAVIQSAADDASRYTESDASMVEKSGLLDDTSLPSSYPSLAADQSIDAGSEPPVEDSFQTDISGRSVPPAAAAPVSASIENDKESAGDRSIYEEGSADPAAQSHVVDNDRPNQGPVAMYMDASVLSAASLYPDQSAVLDGDRGYSPNTSKIRGIVDTRLGQVFGAEVVAHPPLQPAIVLRPAVVTTWKPVDPVSSVGFKLTPPPKLDELEQDLLRVRDLVAQKGPQRTVSGPQARIMNAEIDRTSNLMRRVFSKAGSI